MTEYIELSDKEIEEKIKFLSSARCNHTQHIYIDITGDLIQGTLLSRILYWFAPDKNQHSKVRIFKDGYFWIAKQRKDWWEEIRITERQYDKAIKELEKKGFVELAKYKFNSMPTIHIRPNYDNINIATKRWEEELRKEIINEHNENRLQNEEIGSYTKCNSLGNYTKCNSGVAESVNLLTGITNNDYSNRDYRTENTKFNLFHRYSTSHEYPMESNRELDFEIVKRQIKKELTNLGYGEDVELIKCATEVFEYYYGKYYYCFGEEHTILSKTAMQNTLMRYVEGSDVVVDMQYAPDDYKTMIDKHFTRDYGQEIDYSICHFMTDGIRDRLFYETLY